MRNETRKDLIHKAPSLFKDSPNDTFICKQTNKQKFQLS